MWGKFTLTNVADFTRLVLSRYAPHIRRLELAEQLRNVLPYENLIILLAPMLTNLRTLVVPRLVLVGTVTRPHRQLLSELNYTITHLVLPGVSMVERESHASRFNELSNITRIDLPAARTPEPSTAPRAGTGAHAGTLLYGTLLDLFAGQFPKLELAVIGYNYVLA